MTLNIALIGCGKMGSAMAQSWIRKNIIRSLKIIDPMQTLHLDSDDSHVMIEHYKEIEDAEFSPNSPNVVILAVKPQIMDEVCNQLAPVLPSNTLVISIAAGKTIQSFQDKFGAQQPIIRVMPNTPAAIGEGMSVMVANDQTSAEQKKSAAELLRVTGKVETIEDEALMDAVTAVSGSGPAYVFLLIEAMTEAGVKAGLSEKLSCTLARQTVIGSAYLAEDMDGTPAGTLRQNVTSPGGTTEAALNVLMGENKMQNLMTEAIRAAKKRGEELSN